MKKLYCVIFSKYRKFEKAKTLYIFDKIWILSIIYSKCKNEDKIIFKEEDSIVILKILGLIEVI